MLEKLQQLTKNKILNEKNTVKKQKLEIISKIIADDNCFFKIDVDTALSILKDLDFTKKESLEIYKQLLSDENYNKKEA